MESYTVRRTGSPALEFTGELLASSTSGGRDANRWHELRLYQTKGGKLVLAIEYRTRWEGEKDHFHAVVTDRDQVAGELEMYEPTGNVMGFPPGAQYEAKQARLELGLRAAYAEAVTELLDQAGITEQVE